MFIATAFPTLAADVELSVPGHDNSALLNEPLFVGGMETIPGHYRGSVSPSPRLEAPQAPKPAEAHELAGAPEGAWGLASIRSVI